jgi:hypothetical protein
MHPACQAANLITGRLYIYFARSVERSHKGGEEFDILEFKKKLKRYIYVVSF